MTIYRERANRCFDYWIYSDGARVYVSFAWAMHELRRGAKLVAVK